LIFAVPGGVMPPPQVSGDHGEGATMGKKKKDKKKGKKKKK
jgi:hypothetical protein